MIPRHPPLTPAPASTSVCGRHWGYWRQRSGHQCCRCCRLRRMTLSGPGHGFRRHRWQLQQGAGIPSRVQRVAGLCNCTEQAGALRLVRRCSGSGGGGGGGAEVRRSSGTSSYGGDADASAAGPRRRYARTVLRRGLPTVEAVSFPPSLPLPSWQPIDCSGCAGSSGDLLLRVYDDYYTSPLFPFHAFPSGSLPGLQSERYSFFSCTPLCLPRGTPLLTFPESSSKIAT